MLCGIRSLFKPVYGADIKNVNRSIYAAISGRKCYSDVNSLPFDKLQAPRLLTLTPPCPDYSSSNPNPKGPKEFILLPSLVERIRPLVVFIEEVGNIINFESELVTVLMGLQDSCSMVVHAALVSMQQYGDIENCILEASDCCGA